MKRLFIELVAIRYSPNNSDRKLRFEIKSRAKLVIDSVMQIIRSKNLVLKRKLREPIASLVESVRQRQELDFLLWRSKKLDGNRE
jgi:hypothetical protein